MPDQIDPNGVLAIVVLVAMAFYVFAVLKIMRSK